MAFVAVLGLLLIGGTALTSVAASADTTGPGSGDDPAPDLIAGNPTCATLNGDNAAYPGVTSNFGFKLKPEGAPVNGTYPLTQPPGELTGGAPSDPSNSVTISNSANGFFDWAASLGIDAVIVKGGDNADAFVYVPENLNDTGLHAPFKDDGTTARGISHVEFCYDVEPSVPLTASKTANTSYTKTYEWTIDKSVDPTEHTGTAGDGVTTTADYDVVVTQKVTDDIRVSGNITVNNPAGNPAASFTVTDSVGGTAATVDCDPNAAGNQASGTVAAGGSKVCTYSADLASATDGTNTATVTSTTPGIGSPNPQPSAPYTFGEPTIVGSPTVNVTDNYNDTGDVPLGQALGGTTTFYPESRDFACPTDPSEYENGAYELVFPNTAKINTTPVQSDSAEVKVVCTLPALEVTKTAAGTHDRTIDWTLDKSANPTSFTGVAGDVFNTADLWTVVADKTVDESYKVTGKITIDNPAAIAQSFDVSDQLNDANGTAATVDCDPNAAGNQASGEIAAGGSVECSYTASPGDASATKNTATVKADGNVDQTATAEGANFVWTEHVSGDEQTTLADPRFTPPYVPELIDSDTTRTFTEPLSCAPNSSPLYGDDDQYSSPVTNTATLKGVNGTNLSDSAQVTVTCTRTRVQGGLTIGFWQNKNGQDIIKTGPSTYGVCNSGAYLRTFAPFQDLALNAYGKLSCTDVASYVTKVIKAANASGSSMNAMLKAQMLATALDVNFGKVNGGANVDLTAIPKPVTSTSMYENTSTAFGDGSNTCQTVNALLSYASSQLVGSSWYGGVKATQELAKDTFDAINNHAAFTC